MGKNVRMMQLTGQLNRAINKRKGIEVEDSDSDVCSSDSESSEHSD